MARQIVGLLLAMLAMAIAPPASARDRQDALILISIDGFRADYIDRGLTPTLARLAQGGVTTTAMRPAFPSVTLPNHQTLMTGKSPDRHGVIDNMMVDPALPGWFGGPGPDVTGDPRWWQGAKPLWASAEEQGLRSAELYWPGANVPFAGRSPGLGRPAGTLTLDARVDRILGWLDLPVERRPRFVAAYFGPVDDAGHSYGPDSPQVDAALREVDAALARLVAGLAQRGLAQKVNLVLVSDHGMLPVSYARMVMVDEMVDLAKVQPTTFGAYIGINPLPGHAAEVEAALLRPHEHMTCWRKSEIPERLRYGQNRRVPAIFCLAEPGWLIGGKPVVAWLKGHYPAGFLGNHGYDPADPRMAALFVASGPAFRPNTRLAPFDNVAVYPLLARLLGVRSEPGDGSQGTLAKALR
jgi:predicted AlkP superfamily pyrophosphatase or phosphodiesterase